MRERPALESHLASRDVARVIYGAVVGLALVVALEDHPPTASRVVAALGATALSVGLAELYSEVVGAEARTRARVRRDQLRRFARDAAAVIFGAAFPAVFFLLSAVGVVGLHQAFVLAKWTGLGLVGGYGFVAARLAGAGPLRAGVHATAVAAIGAVVVVLKALVH